MDPDERPLVVQLSWTSDNREGQFVLKKDQESLEVTLSSSAVYIKIIAAEIKVLKKGA